MLSFWEKNRNSESSWNYKRAKAFEDDEDGDEDFQPGPTTYEMQQMLYAKDRVILAPEETFDLKHNFNGFTGAEIAIIPIRGPLMKADNCGYLGTMQMRMLVRMAEETASVHTVICLIDSPGGSVDGTQLLADEIKACSKKTIALVDGMMCSAAYWIGSSCDEIYATSDTDLIGSIGTMISWYDDSKYLEDNGFVLKEFYASDSKEKNAAFREANDGNSKKLVQQLLDPINHVFTAAVRMNRAGKFDEKKENIFTGTVYVSDKAKEAGLIDDIQTFEDILAVSLQTSQDPNINATTMIKKDKPTQPAAGTAVFQQVLAAANAESFPVVEGGFMLSEEQLTALDQKLTATTSQLSQKDTVIDALTAQVTSLKSGTPAADSEAEITSLKTKLESAEANVTKLQTELAAEKKKPGSSFVQTAAGQDDKHEPADDELTRLNALFEKEIDQ